MQSFCFRVVLAIALVAAPVVSSAQARFAQLRGIVKDAATQLPVPLVRVVVAATGRFVQTDSVGRFEIQDIPSGISRFIFQADGYPRAQVVLAFAAGEVMVREFELDSTATPADSAGAGRRVQELSPTNIVATPSRGVRYEDFERRLKTGRGQYVTRERIEAEGYSNLVDAARGLRGISVDCGGGKGCSIRMTRATTGCEPQYIVDGREDNMFGPYVAIRDIEGIEFYTGAADVPGEFAGDRAACGVVVIWTRNGPAKGSRKP